MAEVGTSGALGEDAIAEMLRARRRRPWLDHAWRGAAGAAERDGPGSGGGAAVTAAEAPACVALVPWEHPPHQLMSRRVRCGDVTLELEQEQRAGAALGTGAVLWDSGVVLARYLQVASSSGSLPVAGDLKGRRVLELGAGVGLCGILAARCGATEAVLTDLEPVVPLLQRNTDAAAEAGERNTCTLRVEALPWGDLEAVEAVGAPFDVVLVADCVYEKSDIPALVRTIRAAVDDDGGVALCAVKARYGAAERRFLRLSKDAGFTCQEVAADVLDDEHQTMGITVWALSRGTASP